MKKSTKQTILAAAVLAALTPIAFAAVDARLTVRRYAVESGQIASPVRLAVLTDLHSCAYGPGQRELLEAIYAEDVDAVALVGDIVDDKLPEENAWTTVSALSARYPCYYVTGNHEWRGGEAERICEQMEELGVTVLRGDGASLTVGETTIRLWGVDDPDSGLYETQWAALGNSVKEDTFTILLSHRPERIEEYLRLPFDLILSGHAHGGQWRLPGLINGLVAPHQGLFPAYAGGRYEFDGTVFLVSRGLARENIRVPRIFNRPELLVVELTPEL